MPFGFGPRNCIGMRIALLGIKIALIELLRKYSFVKSANTEVSCYSVKGSVINVTFNFTGSTKDCPWCYIGTQEWCLSSSDKTLIA